MKVEVEVTQMDRFTRSVAVDVPADEVDAVRREVVRELKARAAMPGFRKGRVPDQMIERQFADTIRERTVERVLDPAAREALGRVNERALHPRVEELTWEPGGPLRFRMSVEVRPRLDVTGYKGLTMVREVFEVEDEDVDRAVEDLQRRTAQLVPAYRRAQEGDVIVADVAEAAPGAEPDPKAVRRGLTFHLTPELLQEPLGQALAGTIRGDERRLPLDPAEPGPELWIRVGEVAEEVLPPADDAFFREVGLGDSAALGRVRLRQVLAEEEDRASVRRMAAQIVDDLLVRNPVELAPSQREAVRRLVEEEAKRAAAEGRPAEQTAGLEDQAVKELRRDTLLDSIAVQENITVSDEELDAEISRLAQRARIGSAEARRRLAADGRLETLRRDLLHGKVLGFLVEQASVRVDTKRREGRSRIILPGQGAAGRGGLIVPGR